MLKVSTIDESVGRIVKTLKANGLYENTLIGDFYDLVHTIIWTYHTFKVRIEKNEIKEILLAVFTSDNGSGYRPANLPLRGKKGSVFEVKKGIGFSFTEKFQSFDK